MMKYRHEYKYRINIAEYFEIRARLKVLCRSDEHSGHDGRYRVRSLYFDNADDLVLREKIDGVRNREKFRIRYYNDDISFLRLEKKSKRNDLCVKQSAVLTVKQVEHLLQRENCISAVGDIPILSELAVKMKIRGLRPKTIVDYEREAYICPMGNVRLNFDTNIRTGMYSLDFLNPRSQTILTEDQIIFEVKYDSFFPEYIYDAIQTGTQTRCAFSKYAVARMYG
ncbi:MAG: polyphosphate polymerase domain-containing protein [Thermoguttaceae bacterium]|nr:polyphosphate polymerase domain-containing protein [Thermoguttaceae bacterium]